MVFFFCKTEQPEKITQFFCDMINRGVEHGYNININAWLWSYKQKENSFFIKYKMCPSWFVFNWFFYGMFKLSLKFRYKTKVKKISVANGIDFFIGE